MTGEEQGPVGEGGGAFYEALTEDDPLELYENAPCGYLSALPDGTIVRVNATFLRWTGYARAELVGKVRFHQLLAPGDRIFYETHYVPLLRMQGSVREIAVDLVMAGGTRLPVLLNSVTKLGPDGAPVMVRTAVFDATERRAYERELLAARQRAETSEARASALARTLQASFLPPAHPAVPFLEVGGAYRPAGDGSEVGGDFYDVFDTGRGTWGIVLGDVSGKGAEAAVVTSLARDTVRTEALRAASPGEVLAALHGAILRYHPERFCTAVLCVVEPMPDGTRVAIAAGGHHLPLVVGHDGAIRSVGESGSILGMIEAGHWPVGHVRLGPGETLVVFSDGVPEGRRDGEFFGEERIRRILAEQAEATVQSLVTALVESAVGFQRGDARDDITVVAFRPAASA